MITLEELKIIGQFVALGAGVGTLAGILVGLFKAVMQ